jgi:4-amino-4-deoxy-L-arabinose transferase-like glycosyltransferase
MNVAMLSKPPSSWQRSVLIALLVVLYACLLQGVRPLYSPDEGRYTNVALAMLDDGDWVHPVLHHNVEHWSKPPLTYWTIAASVSVFGRHESAARLPSALAFAATILLIGRLGRRFVPQQPWLPALIYATFVLPSLAANLVTTDSLLALWETLEIVAFVDLWWAANSLETQRARYLLGVALGLAFMTKGPPGLLAFAGCIVFAIVTRGWAGLRRALAWQSLLLFMIVGGSWYALVAWQEPKVLHQFLVEEVVNRVASDSLHRNAQWYGPLKIYLPTLLLGTLPWLPILLKAIWRYRSRGWTVLRDDEHARFLMCWFLLPLTVFVIARSRLPLYLLPLFAPLAIITARQIAPLSFRPRPMPIALAVWCVGIIAVRAAPAWMDVESDDRKLAHEIARNVQPIPQDIEFVEAAPRFGLRFYLGSEIERLGLPGEPRPPQSQALASEIKEYEGCRLMIVEASRLADLLHSLQELDTTYLPPISVGGYVLIRHVTPDCVWKDAGDRITAASANRDR